jgi:hypothetical protein
LSRWRVGQKVVARPGAVFIPRSLRTGRIIEIADDDSVSIACGLSKGTLLVRYNRDREVFYPPAVQYLLRRV